MMDNAYFVYIKLTLYLFKQNIFHETQTTHLI